MPKQEWYRKRKDYPNLLFSERANMITFYVNGKKIETNSQKKLLPFLRDDLRLTSVKDGCSEAHVELVPYWWTARKRNHA